MTNDDNRFEVINEAVCLKIGEEAAADSDDMRMQTTRTNMGEDLII